MKRAAIISCLIYIIGATGGADAIEPSDLRGLTGREILNELKREKPSTLITSSLGLNGSWVAVCRYAVRDDGSLTDYYSDSHDYRPGNIAIEPPQGVELLTVAPAAWWGAVYGDTIASDLVNLLPANFDVAAYKRNYPPGVVAGTFYDNGFWRSGVATIAATETNVYEPADRYKGDFARIYMYMAAVYPMSFWQSYGPMVYADGDYPLLNGYSRRMLLDWHRADPVDAIETRRNAAIEEAQGSGNPFVAIPEIAEYIWGANAGEPFVPPSDDSTPRQPLKGRYSIARDKYISLYSPYIAEDVSWSIDGTAVSNPESTIPLNSLGTGPHTVTYSNERLHGSLIIIVEP